MRLLAPLGPARTLVTAQILRRGVLLGTLALAERVLTAAAAWSLFRVSLDMKVAVCAALGAVLAARTLLRQAFASRTEAELVERLISSVLDGDVLKATILPTEDAQADLSQGAYLTARQLSDVLPTLGADAAASVILGGFVVLVEPARLVVGGIALATVAAIALTWSYDYLHRAVEASWSLRGNLIDKLVDAIEGRLEIVAAVERGSFAGVAHRLARDWAQAAARAAAAAAVSGRAPLLVIASAIVAMAVETRAFRSSPAMLGDLALLASVTPAFAGVAQGLVALLQTDHMTRAVVHVVATARVPRAGAPPPALPFPIEFDTVSFRYGEADNDVLSDLTLRWQDERIIGLSGTNGSGKSTLLRLLLALGQPTKGTIRVGGMDLSHLDADDWRKRIAFLPQRPYLPVRGDVRMAVRLLAPTASNARIEQALERTGMLETLRCVRPDPLAVSVEALSVGQRQRIALARLLCRDASLFVLDEPDANLDRAGIALVADLTRELSRVGRVIVAAHTPELLKVADRVILLDAGRVIDRVV
jgi:ATP-binding cassette subfamily C protein CydCD